MSENVTDLLALIERLRAEIVHLRATLDDHMARQDAAQALQRGSMAPPAADSEPGTITHDVPPNAPR